MTLACDIVALVRVLQRVRDVDDVIQVPDAERGVAFGNFGIGERPRIVDGLEVFIENVHGSSMKVGGIKEVAIDRAGNREPLVDGVGSCHCQGRLGRYRGRRYIPIPAQDRSVFSRENERRRAARAATGDNKPGSAVEDNPGRRARHIDAVTRDGRQLNLGSRAGIEGRRIGAVIGYPPGRRSARDQSPGIDQRGIDQVGSARLIGYQIVLSVELGDGRICRAEHKSYP